MLSQSTMISKVQEMYTLSCEMRIGREECIKAQPHYIDVADWISMNHVKMENGALKDAIHAWDIAATNVAELAEREDPEHIEAFDNFLDLEVEVYKAAGIIDLSF